MPDTAPTWTLTSAHIDYRCSNYRSQWPTNDSEALKNWSGFCFRLETRRKDLQSFGTATVSISDLDDMQKAAAIQCIKERNWVVQVQDENIIIQDPDFK